ncbi:unnamed protein product [Lactuca saligna]|uniref:Uncharacterized protein n=1 Tax=Lactuca saligna TaxID=75948 RepID=A0AA36E8R2_LACSI|nr:unnamed protein product [Lactuca saligna]
MYETLSTSPLQLIFKKKVPAYEVWQNIEKAFRDNKVNKVIQIDNKLRNISMGNSNNTEYCNRIKNIADLLENMDAKVFSSFPTVLVTDGTHQNNTKCLGGYHGGRCGRNQRGGQDGGRFNDGNNYSGDYMTIFSPVGEIAASAEAIEVTVHGSLVGSRLRLVFVHHSNVAYCLLLQMGLNNISTKSNINQAINFFSILLTELHHISPLYLDDLISQGQ